MKRGGWGGRAVRVALVALALAGCGRAARDREPLRSDPQLGWFWRPGLQVAGRPWTNALGLHDLPRAARPAPASVRILFLGDERALEPGVPELTLPQLVEQALWGTDPNRQWEAVNAAVVGYGPEHEADFLRIRGFDLAPAAVVLLFNGTDDFLRERVPPEAKPVGADRSAAGAARSRSPDRESEWRLSGLGSRRGLWFGWASSEPNGIWIQGRVAGFGFRADPAGGLQLELEAAPLPRSSGESQALALEINGQSLAGRALPIGLWSTLRWQIAARLLRPGINAVRLRAAWTISPQALGVSSDTRLLSVQVRAIRFSRPVIRVTPTEADLFIDPILSRWVGPPDPSSYRRQLEFFLRLESPSVVQDHRHTLSRLSQLKQLFGSRRIPWVVAVLPHPVQLSPLRFSDTLRRWDWAPEGLDWDRPQRILRDWSQAARVPFLDLRGVMAEQTGQRWDPRLDRWSYDSRQRAAGAIAAALQELLMQNQTDLLRN